MILTNVMPIIIKVYKKQSFCFFAKSADRGIFIIVPSAKIFLGIYFNIEFSTPRGPITKGPLTAASAA
jgi:hypothetical protein